MSKRKKAWQQFCDEAGATYVKGGVLKSDRIEASFQGWPIVYDTMAIPAGNVILIYTRLRAPFLAKSDFKFRISKKSFLTKFAEKIGKSKLKTGDPRIDDNFLIKHNSDEKIRQLLSGEKLKEHLLEKTKSHFELSHGYKSVGRQFPKGCDGLSLVVLYEGGDKDRLMLFHNLIGEMLVALAEAGEIDAAPDVKLK